MSTREQAKSAIDAMFDLSDAIAQQRDKYRAEIRAPKIYETPTYEIALGDWTVYATQENVFRVLTDLGRFTDEIAVFRGGQEVTEHIAEQAVQRRAKISFDSLRAAYNNEFLKTHAGEHIDSAIADLSAGEAS